MTFAQAQRGMSKLKPVQGWLRRGSIVLQLRQPVDIGSVFINCDVAGTDHGVHSPTILSLPRTGDAPAANLPAQAIEAPVRGVAVHFNQGEATVDKSNVP